VLLASNARQPVAAAATTSPEEWRTDVTRVARDGLAVVRRLAAGVAPSDMTSVQHALREVAERCRVLASDVPTSMSDRVELTRMLDVAAAGAGVEAARLSGVTVMRGDRREFLAALRGLRDVSARGDVHDRDVGATAVRSVAPSFTVA
jgi:hypothetical protein